MLDSVAPHKKLIIQRRINLERRRNCNDRVCELYEHYINTANSSLTSTFLTVKYARFVWKVCTFITVITYYLVSIYDVKILNNNYINSILDIKQY